jgi:hypothetical protein
LCDILVAQFADRAIRQDFQCLFDEQLICPVAGNEQVDVLRGAHEAEAVDRKPADHHVGDTQAVEFPGQRNQIGVGRNARYFPRRIKFIVHVVQASWVENRNTPLGWPRPWASRADVRCRRAKRCQGVLCNWPMTLTVGSSTEGKIRPARARVKSGQSERVRLLHVAPPTPRDLKITVRARGHCRPGNDLTPSIALATRNGLTPSALLIPKNPRLA